MLIVILHCLFQAHSHTTFQQLTFTHTETGRAFCCFFLWGIFFFLSQHMLLNSKALSCSTGWLLSPFLSGDAEISFRPLTWIFGLCSSYVLGSGSRVASHQAAVGKWSPPLSEMWLFESAVITLKMLQMVRRGHAGVCCVREGVVQTHRSQCLLSYLNLL